MSSDVEAWATWMRAQSWSESTIVARLRTVVRAAGGRDPVSLELVDVVEYLAGDISAASRHTYDANLRAWFRWCVSSGRRATDPMVGHPAPRVPRSEIVPIRTEHVQQLLTSGIRSRTRTMVLLAAYQGLRASEIARVRGRDVDLIGQTLTVLGKGGVRATLPLHPLVADRASLYGPAWWFFQHVPNRNSPEAGHVLGNSVSRVVGEAMTRAGIPGTCHSLRHWYASEMLRQGADIRVIQQLLRHASLGTTERYLHVDSDQRHAAIARLPLIG